jgi:translation elongation factor EF-Tu-like GTPase
MQQACCAGAVTAAATGTNVPVRARKSKTMAVRRRMVLMTQKSVKGEDKAEG